MTEPFKVGDVIERTNESRWVTLEWASDDDGAGSQFVAGHSNDGYPFAALIYPPDWRIHVPEPERKRWTLETERRSVKVGEFYVHDFASITIERAYPSDAGDALYVIVAGSVKPLPEEQK